MDCGCGDIIMNISSATYQKDIDDASVNAYVVAVIDGVAMTVPIDTDNRHYQAIQEWVSEGNTIEEAS